MADRLTADRSAERFEAQASQYRFPYHWLPGEDEHGWSIAQELAWGLEYFGVLTRVRDLALRRHPASVLDFGCGDGRLVYELAIRGVPRVVGIDLVPEAIWFAKAFTAPLGDRVHVDCVALESLERRTFDLIVAMEVLEHIPDGDVAPILRQLRERLAPGGALIVSVPTKVVPLNPKHERHYDAALLRGQVLAHFAWVDHEYVHAVGRLERLLRRLMTNRLGVTKSPLVRRVVTAAYQRRVLNATEHNGAHLIAVLRPEA